MARREIKTGFTLTEILVVVVIMSLLIGIALPTAKEIMNSLNSSAGVKNVIGAALANTRAMAMSRGKYVGLRFQEDLKGNHYIIFIVHDTDVGPGIPGGLGCRAITGRKPIRLPVNVGLMDLRVKDYTDANPFTTEEPVEVPNDNDASDLRIDDAKELLDTNTFSMLFSPSGKLVQHVLKVAHSDSVGGDIFNTQLNVGNGIGMFFEDENYNHLPGLQVEQSRISFFIYDKKKFERIDSLHRWTDYLQYLAEVYVNPYTGEIVHRERTDG